MIRVILRRHGISGVRVYANRLRWLRERLIPSFPYQDRRCARGCAHCKQQHVGRDRRESTQVIYIGDGRSDLCAAEQADGVFAKGNLLDYLRSARQPCRAFQSLADVYDDLKECL